MVDIPSVNQLLGIFLVARSAYSIAYSECKSIGDQVGRLAVMGIGVFLFEADKKKKRD